jgi:uncharacterized membrane protein
MKTVFTIIMVFLLIGIIAAAADNGCSKKAKTEKSVDLSELTPDGNTVQYHLDEFNSAKEQWDQAETLEDQETWAHEMDCHGLQLESSDSDLVYRYSNDTYGMPCFYLK